MFQQFKRSPARRGTSSTRRSTCSSQPAPPRRVADVTCDGVVGEGTLSGMPTRKTLSEGPRATPITIGPGAGPNEDISSYFLDSDVGAAEWAKLAPPRCEGLLFHVKDDTSDPNNASDMRKYSVTLFLQLKCLDVIHRQYTLPLLPSTGIEGKNRTPPARPTARHCMNYLRQTIWCQPSLWLESVMNATETVSKSYNAVCRNWNEVYNAAAPNPASLLQWTAAVVVCATCREPHPIGCRNFARRGRIRIVTSNSELSLSL